MSMPSNSNFHENATPDAEPEGVDRSQVVSTEDTPSAVVGAPASSDITLRDRLAAMRMLSLQYTPRNTSYRPVNNILLHIFLFPQHIMRLASTRVSVTSYLQTVDNHDLVCEKQAMECVGSLGKDVFLKLKIADLLIFPWFLLTQEKLIELESCLKVRDRCSHELLSKMPQTFFKEFESRHSGFPDFLTGALRNLMNQKADYVTHKKQIADKHRKKKQIKRLQQPLNLSTQPRRQLHVSNPLASVFAHVPISVPVHMPSVPASVFPVRMPTRAPLLATSAGMTYAPPFTTGMGEGMQQPGMFMQQTGVFMQQPGMFVQQAASDGDLFNNRPPIAPAYMVSVYQPATCSSEPPDSLAEVDRTLAETSSLKRFFR